MPAASATVDKTVIAEHIVAALLEDDFDPKDEVDALLPHGPWHPVHGIDNKFLRTFFNEYGLKLLRTYRGRRDGEFKAVVQNVGGLVDFDTDLFDIERLLKKYLWKIDPTDQILVHLFQGDRHREAGKLFVWLERRDTHDKWQAKCDQQRRDEEEAERQRRNFAMWNR